MAMHAANNGARPMVRGLAQDEPVFEYVRRALKDLQFGTVTIVVQNGRVVQIERHEKTRLGQPDPE